MGDQRSVEKVIFEKSMLYKNKIAIEISIIKFKENLFDPKECKSIRCAVKGPETLTFSKLKPIFSEVSWKANTFKF